MTWRRSPVGPAVLTVLVLAACGSSASTLDPDATETAVGEAVAPEVEPAIVEVACPDTIDREPAGTFECRIELDDRGGSLAVTVRQVDDEGSLEVDPQAAVLADEDLAVEARAALRASFERSFQVDCGDGPPTVREPGTTVGCRARDADSRREVTVTVTDATGTLGFEVGDPISG